MTGPAPTPRTRAYSLVLPPGFVLISAQGNVGATVRTIVRQYYREISNDRTNGRIRRLEKSLVQVVERARDRGIVDVVLPLGTPWQVPLSLSLAFAPAPAGGAPATGPASTAVVTRAGEARREVVEHEDSPAPDLDVDLPDTPPGGTLRTVHHVWQAPSPGVPHLVGTFAVSGSDDPELAPMVDALTELGDTIMTSLRWTDTTDDTEEPA